MSRKTIYKKISFTLDPSSSFVDYDSDTGYRGYGLIEKIDKLIDSTKDKYKSYRLVKLISVIFPGEIIEDKMDYNYPLDNIDGFNFYNSFRDYVYPGREFVAKVGFVFEK